MRSRHPKHWKLSLKWLISSRGLLNAMLSDFEHRECFVRACIHNIESDTQSTLSAPEGFWMQCYQNLGTENASAEQASKNTANTSRKYTLRTRRLLEAMWSDFEYEECFGRGGIENTENDIQSILSAPGSRIVYYQILSTENVSSENTFHYSLNMSLACRVPTQIWRVPCP